MVNNKNINAQIKLLNIKLNLVFHVKQLWFVIFNSDSQFTTLLLEKQMINFVLQKQNNSA